jgi:site-specific recombinase XerD
MKREVGRVGQGGSSLGQTHFYPNMSFRHKANKSGSVVPEEKAGKKSLPGDYDSLLDRFLYEAKATGHRAQGVKGLRSRVGAFLAYLAEREIAVSSLSLETAYEYQGYHLSRRNDNGTRIAKRTVASYLVAASAFMAWACRVHCALDNPFTRIRRVRAERMLPHDVRKEHEIAGILDTARDFVLDDPASALARYRAHVIGELQYASGLRISEVASLAEQDIDFDRAIIHVRDGKHGSNRVAFLNDYARDVLEAYCQTIRPILVAASSNDSDRLFLLSRDRLGHNQNEALARLCRASGCPATRSHGFRHALGYHLLRAGCGIRHIQAILGHKRIKDTEIYTKVDVEDVQRTLERCHPRTLA